MSETSWMDRAACLGMDPDLFFSTVEEAYVSKRPSIIGAKRDAEAKEICSRCMVRKKCLDYALKNNEKIGVWGGMTAQERRRYKKDRQKERRIKRLDGIKAMSG